MKCNNCPLFSSWNNESDRGEACGIFGDDWGNDFQYEDEHGAVIGCYLERCYINKVEMRIEEQHEEMVKDFVEKQRKGVV